MRSILDDTPSPSGIHGQRQMPKLIKKTPNVEARVLKMIRLRHVCYLRFSFFVVFTKMEVQSSVQPSSHIGNIANKKRNRL